MAQSGDWWTPRLHHDTPHFSKPPLTYWSLAAAISAFGRNEWAVRLPNAIAWCGTVLLVFAIARRVAPGRELLAATIQATALLPFAAMNVVTTDTLLAFFETLAVAGFVRARWDASGVRAGAFWMWTGFGLAFLTKGPPGLLPLLAILVFLLMTEGVRGLARLRSPAGWLAFLLIAGGWYAAQMAAYPDLARYFFGQEIVDRIASDRFHRNAGLRGILRAYAPVILAGMLPWLPWAISSWLRTRSTTGRARAVALETQFLAGWLSLPLLVFVVSSSRLPLYLLPLAPPAALLFARVLPADALASRKRRVWIAAWLVLLLAVKGLAAIYPSDRDGRRLAARLRVALPYPPLELVVIHRKPRYSLAFYLHTEVEAVALDGRLEAALRSGFLPPEMLSSELSEAEPGTIYLVPVRLREPFLKELEERGWTGRRVGRVEDYEIFAMPRHLPGA